MSAPRGELLRLLGAGFGIAIAVGEMIGPGILRTPGLVAVAVPVAGTMLALWAFGALHAFLQANVLAELSVMLPRAGGQYVFAHRAFGAAGGVLVGWSMWCQHVAGLAAASIAFAEFLGSVLPGEKTYSPGMAVAVLAVLFAINIGGLRQGRALQMATTIAKVSLLVAFAAAALLITPHVSPAAPAKTAVGLLALASGYQLIRGAYNGWLAPVYFSEENVAPAKSIPKSLFVGIALTGALYVAVNAGLLHALSPAQMTGGALPYLKVLAGVSGAWSLNAFAAGAMIIAASCANANVMIAPRILFALSRDRLLPESLQAVNRGGSPWAAFAVTAVVAFVLAATGGFRLVFGLIGTLATFACLLTEISYFVLRRREPGLVRPWNARAHPLAPALAVFIDAGLLVLFATADPRGAMLAGLLGLLCVPLIVIRHFASG